MTDYDNPARRLHAFLAAVRAHGQSGSGMGTVIGEYFGVEYPSDMPMLLRSLAPVYELPQQVRDEVNALGWEESSSAVLIRHLPGIEGALGNLTLPQQILQFNGQISDVAFESLEHCGVILGQFRPQRTLDSATIGDLRNTISGLVADVMAADELDESIAQFMLDHLHELLWTLDSYKVSGIVPIEWAVQRAVGHAALDSAEAVRVQETDAGKRFWSTVAKVGMALNLVTGPLAIAQAAVPDAFPKAAQGGIVIDVPLPQDNGTVTVTRETHQPAPQRDAFDATQPAD
jgi:hypothetical protein